MFPTFIGRIDIQSCWEVPSIAHFASLFNDHFKLPEFDIEDLEEALLADGTEIDSNYRLLPELIVTLLKGCSKGYVTTGLTTCNYQMFLRRLFRRKCKAYNIENPFNEDTDFQSLSPRTKLKILHLLCDFRLDGAELNNIKADCLRIEPLGFDEHGSTYWYFYGTRLYREDFLSISEKKKRRKLDPNASDTIWQVICFTEDDWKNLAAKLEKSTNRRARALYNILKVNFLPKIPSLFKEKERQRRRKLIQIHRINTNLLNETKENSVINKNKLYKKNLTDQLFKSPVLHSVKTDRQIRAEKRIKDLEPIEDDENDIENIIDQFDEKYLPARRRSRSTSLASIITTYASSTSTIESNDIFFQQNNLISTSSRKDQLNSKVYDNSTHLSVKKITTSGLKNSKEFQSDDKENINTVTSSTSSDENEDLSEFSSEENKNLSMKSNKVGGKNNKKMAPAAPTPTITKLPGRQTNNSLSSITGNIVIQTSAPTSQPQQQQQQPPPPPVVSTSNPTNKSENVTAVIRKKKSKQSEVFTEDDEVLQIGMHKVLEAVKNHNDAWPFMDPVEEDIAPRYYSIIRRPMDLLKMEEKLDNGEYTHFSQFRNDFKLIVNNCRLYNGQENEYTEMVNNLQVAFEKATKKYFEQNSSDEEQNLEYPELKTSVFREKYLLNKSFLNNKDNEMDNDDDNDNDDRDDDRIDNLEKNEKINFDKKSKDHSDNNDHNKSSKNKNKTKKEKYEKKLEKKMVMDGVNKNEEDDHDKEKSKISKGVKRKRKEKEKKKKKRKLDKTKYKDEDDQHSDCDMSEDEHHFENENVDENLEEKEIINRKEENLKHKSPKKYSKKNKLLTEKGHKKNITKLDKKIDNEIITKLKSSSKEEENQISTSSGLDKKMKSKKKLQKNSKDVLLSKKHKNEFNSSDSVKKNELYKTESIKKSYSKSFSDENIEEDDNKGDFSSDESVIDYPIKSKTKKSKDKSKSNTNNKTGKDKEKDILLSSSSKTCDDNNKNVKKSKPEYNKSPKSPSHHQTDLFKKSKYKKKIKSASKNDSSDFTSSKLTVENIKSQSQIINRSSDKDDDDDDLQSISSRSFSRGPSPLRSDGSSNDPNDFNNSFDYDFDEEKIMKNLPSKPPTPDIKDKFDLIKERRSRLNDDKWNQVVKEAEKISKKNSNTKSTQIVKDKNHKLNETIQKLKMRNAKVKQKDKDLKQGKKKHEKSSSSLKPKEKHKDKLEKKKKGATKENKKEISNKLNAPMIEASDEYDFIDNDIPPPTPNPAIIDRFLTETSGDKEKKVKKSKKDESDKKKENKEKHSSKKNLSKKSATSNTSGKKSNTNVAALDFEAEQTLKDINKWLEHTPRFSEFSSASNSPSRYTLEDIDAVQLPQKLDPSHEFKKSTSDQSKTEPQLSNNDKDKHPSVSTKTSIPNSQPTSANPISSNQSTVQQPTSNSNINTTSLTPKKEAKEGKRKSIKEKLNLIPRKRELHRTIDRLQPGKSKGNLISNIQNSCKTDELYPLGNLAKLKEVKNSLVVKTDESGPKLSLGTVLNTENFGLVQQHNFSDEAEMDKLKISEVIKDDEPDESVEEDKTAVITEEIDNKLKEKNSNLSILKVGDEEKIESFQKQDEVKNEDVKVEKNSKSTEKPNPTPNLSAWFKAFGAPKSNVQKKKDELDENNRDNPINSDGSDSKKSNEVINPIATTTSPSSVTTDNLQYTLPAQRQRKASTGSTVSERSSFSQDPDSPRIGIDERLGQFSSTFPSPIGASPIMVSPKPDDIPKASPYSLNGAIKVGFYQDTTTKSSPDKSCSPRDLPATPFPSYSQHVYSSASPTSFNYSTTYNPSSDNINYNKQTAAPANYYEQYKQPHSQESDYNSSMSPNTNPNSPYQSQPSPFPQPNSPYHKSQSSSPYQQPANNTPNHISNPNSPYETSPNAQQQQSSPSTSFQHTPQSQLNPLSPHSPFSQSNHSSPYSQHDPNSPYSNNGDMSPFQSMSPKQTPSTVPTKSNNLQDWSTSPSSNNGNSNQQKLSNYNASQNILTQNSELTHLDSNRNSDSNSNSSNNLNASTNISPQSHSSSSQQIDSNINITPTNLSNLHNQKPDLLHQSSYLANPDAYSNFQNNSKIPNGNQQTLAQHLLQPPNIYNSQSSNLDSSLLRNHLKGQSTNDDPCMNNMINMGYNPTTDNDIHGIHGINKDNSENTNTKLKDQDKNLLDISGMDSLNKKSNDVVNLQTRHDQMFDHLLGSMPYGKTTIPGFGKPITDISTTKAIDMFNKAASYPKTLPSPSNSTNVNTRDSQHLYQENQQQNILNMGFSNKINDNNQLKGYNLSSGENLSTTNMVNQQQNKINLRSHQMEGADMSLNKSNQELNLNTQNKMGSDLMSPYGTRAHVNQSQPQIGMDINAYKSFNTPGPPIVDPSLRNITSLSMIDRYGTDERFLGIQGAASGYYDNKIGAQHMFSKAMQQTTSSAASIQPMFGSPNMTGLSYTSRSQSDFNVQSQKSQLIGQQTSIHQTGMNLDTKTEKKPKKLTKKAQAALAAQTAAAAAAAAQTQQNLTQNQNTTSQQQQQQQQQTQQVQSQQGFQCYAGIKNMPTSSVTSTTESTPISLKTSSVVPGSAFNFGPSATGLGIYGENSSYLDDYRNAPNPYYLTTSHRSTPDSNDDKGLTNPSTAAVAAASPYHQFLSHQARTTYPFVNTQLDANPTIYQQYVNNMINQGLLGAGAPPGTYPQSTYHPLNNLMHKHYDAMNARPWFP